MARGKYIARLDADDEWLGRNKLARQVEFLESHPDHVLLGTGAVVVDAQRREQFRFLEPTDDAAIRKRILGRICFQHGSVVMRAAAARAVGGYDERADCRHVEDFHLWLKLGTVGKLANLPIHGLRYAVSGSQISSVNRVEQLANFLAVAHEFRSEYPGHLRAAVRNRLRLVVYGHLRLDWLMRLAAGR
jgi:glycosyltransferase involved in cell wall biosynthesis